MIYTDFDRESYKGWAETKEDSVILGTFFSTISKIRGVVRHNKVTLFAEEAPGIIPLGSYDVAADYDFDLDSFVKNLFESLENRVIMKDNPASFYVAGEMQRHHENDCFLNREEAKGVPT